jgi:hypothetical protein
MSFSPDKRNEYYEPTPAEIAAKAQLEQDNRTFGQKAQFIFDSLEIADIFLNPKGVISGLLESQKKPKTDSQLKPSCIVRADSVRIYANLLNDSGGILSVACIGKAPDNFFTPPLPVLVQNIPNYINSLKIVMLWFTDPYKNRLYHHEYQYPEYLVNWELSKSGVITINNQVLTIASHEIWELNHPISKVNRKRLRAKLLISIQNPESRLIREPPFLPGHPNH